MTTADASLALAGADAFGAARRATSRSAAVLRRRWPALLGLVAFVAYAWVGIHLLFDGGYAIGDALARSAQARNVVDSRDPHLAAVGFVWMPLPTLAQLPFSAVLSIWDVAAASGPLSTAMFGAATIPVLAGICRRIGLRPAAQVAVVLAYACNPVVVFYAVNGMSEASFFFFASLACAWYLRWVESRRSYDLGVLGLVLAGASLTRYEAYGMTLLFGVAVALHMPRRRWVPTVVLVALPAMTALAVWMVTSHVLLRDATFFLRGLRNSATPPADAPWLPAERNLASGFTYSLPLVVRLSPAILALLPLALLDDARRWTRTRGRPLVVPVVLLAAGLLFPASVVWLMARDETWGNPRYFAPMILFTTVMAAWLMRPGSLVPRRWHGAVVLVLVVGWATGLATIADRGIAAIEGEPFAVHQILGIGSGQPTASNAYALRDWRALVDQLDDLTGADDLVAADATASFPAPLFSAHPERFVIPSDRDFERLVANPDGRITFVIVQRLVSADVFQSSVVAILDTAPPGMRWEQIGAYSIADLYQLQRDAPAEETTT
jgi:hypothetical protein